MRLAPRDGRGGWCPRAAVAKLKKKKNPVGDPRARLRANDRITPRSHVTLGLRNPSPTNVRRSRIATIRRRPARRLGTQTLTKRRGHLVRNTSCAHPVSDCDDRLLGPGPDEYQMLPVRSPNPGATPWLTLVRVPPRCSSSSPSALASALFKRGLAQNDVPGWPETLGDAGILARWWRIPGLAYYAANYRHGVAHHPGSPRQGCSSARDEGYQPGACGGWLPSGVFRLLASPKRRFRATFCLSAGAARGNPWLPR